MNSRNVACLAMRHEHGRVDREPLFARRVNSGELAHDAVSALLRRQPSAEKKDGEAQSLRSDSALDGQTCEA